ncbi:MAG: fumarate hydratase, partial [Eggerthellaceae bacterium]|nr:fumarate hydratase [Eggerthellaceae bacterium]
MENALTAERVAAAVYDAVCECAVTLRPDFARAVEAARAAALADAEAAGDNAATDSATSGGAARARSAQAASILGQVLENAEIGRADGVPICQDTGTVWVCLEVGEQLCVPGNVFSQVDDAVARAYTDGRL